MREILHKVQQTLFESARKSTIPLFHNNKPEWEKSVPELVGSGVLIELDGNYYIVTAAYVVQGYALKKSRNPYKTEDDYDDPSEAYLTLNNIGFYNDESYYPLQRVVFTNTENGSIENDVDFAVIFLDLESANELKHSFIFISIDKMVLNHDVNTENRYYIFGYPANGTEIIETTKIIKLMPFEYVTNGVLPQNISGIECDIRYNLLVSYDKRRIVDTRSRQPLEHFAPQGISGCGLWYNDGERYLKLIGVMTEDKSIKEHQPLMMATKIDEIIAIIRQKQMGTDF